MTYSFHSASPINNQLPKKHLSIPPSNIRSLKKQHPCGRYVRVDWLRVVAVAKGVMIEYVRWPYVIPRLERVIPRWHEIVKVVT
jgi:hypothetical protein